MEQFNIVAQAYRKSKLSKQEQKLQKGDQERKLKNH